MDLERIQNKIYEVRGVKVMLDFDLAEIYNVETRVLNQQVRRNIERFPEDFMFQLTKTEWDNMSSQFVMTSRAKRPKSSTPLAFTEHGTVMLSSVLRSQVAIDASILVVRAFVAVRHLMLNPPINEVKELQKDVRQLKQDIEDVFADYNDINEDTQMQIDSINQKLELTNIQFSEIYKSLIDFAEYKKELDKPRNPIGFRK